MLIASLHIVCSMATIFFPFWEEIIKDYAQYAYEKAAAKLQ